MEAPKIYETEYRFCCIIWAHEPVGSGELVKLAARELGWKKSTTYTIIKRLCERGILKSENAVITSLYSREQIQRRESREFLDKTFDGSLPAFLAAFAESKSLSSQDVAEIRKMIDHYEVK
ncbi:MAG: BlaI/MecI/CopY family transcriptional regulator [Intestinimonas sp.]|jgi:predicted transcriptional regulator|nr:BlaI/MecI/CopY family transcriptional regulator [Intestinimonas sp.]